MEEKLQQTHIMERNGTVAKSFKKLIFINRGLFLNMSWKVKTFVCVQCINGLQENIKYLWGTICVTIPYI